MHNANDLLLSGTSKQGNNVVKFEESDDDEDWSNNDNRNKVNDRKDDKKKEGSVLDRVFNKSKPAPAPTVPTRKIVGER